MQPSDMLSRRWFDIAVVSSLLMIAVGVGIVATTNLYPTVIVRHVDVQVTHTDWYNSGTFSAQQGDWFSINVHTSGGDGKLVVRRTNGSDIFGELQSSSLVYEVNVNDPDTYFVQIWTRSWPWPSNFIDLSGTIDQNRVVFSTMGYLTVGLVVAGLSVISGSFLLLRHQKILAKKLELEFRDCPSCGKRVSINEPVCPYCGHDILTYIKCTNCGISYDRTRSKCPNCGAPSK